MFGLFAPFATEPAPLLIVKLNGMTGSAHPGGIKAVAPNGVTPVVNRVVAPTLKVLVNPASL